MLNFIIAETIKKYKKYMLLFNLMGANLWSVYLVFLMREPNKLKYSN